jgi:L-cysteine desulfidase
MRVFNDTPYQNAVKKFLESLNKAFQSNLDDEINNYITTTTDFTEDEKKICLEVQGYMSRLQASMKKGIFNDAINHSVTSNEVMSSYSDTLKEFNEYTKTIATDPLKYDVVDRFKKMLPVLAAQKIQPDIFFDA